MNWFQRYGIPGAYFIGLSMAWAHAFYSCMFQRIFNKVDGTELILLAAIIFIPIGYVISVFQQWIYLKCKCLGMHRAGINLPRKEAMKKAEKKAKMYIKLARKKKYKEKNKTLRDKAKNIVNKTNERFPECRYNDATNEVDVLLLSVNRVMRKKIEIEVLKFAQLWVNKRTDVVAINFSLIIATVLSIVNSSYFSKGVFWI